MRVGTDIEAKKVWYTYTSFVKYGICHIYMNTPLGVIGKWIHKIHTKGACTQFKACGCGFCSAKEITAEYLADLKLRAE